MNSLHSYSSQLTEQLLSFLWRQWSSIGVGGHSSASDHWVIDPEALLLFSTTIARHDPRLFDEILDWLQLNGSRINLQRLTRMHQNYSSYPSPTFGDGNILAAIGSTLSQQSQHLKWQSLTKLATTKKDNLDSETSTTSPLFIANTNASSANSVKFTADTDWSGFETDSHFASYGFLRSPLRLRGLSTAPKPHQLTNLLFKLRSLFGVNTRAESLAWLLCHPKGHPAEIARDTGYFNRSLQITLNEMSDSGHLRSFRTGREKYFSLYPSDWKFLLKGEHTTFPTWINWAPLFSALSQILTLLSSENIDQKSTPAQAIKIRQVIERITPELANAGLIHHWNTSPELTGSALIEQTLTDIQSLLS